MPNLHHVRHEDAILTQSLSVRSDIRGRLISRLDVWTTDVDRPSTPTNLHVEA